MATINELEFEIERRGIIFHKDTSMSNGLQLEYSGNPNNVINGSTPGESLIYNCPSGTVYIDKNITPYNIYDKVEDLAGGLLILRNSIFDLPIADGVTVTLYVDTMGDDINGDGSILYPYKTLTRVLQQISKYSIDINDKYIINIGKGTYSFNPVEFTEYISRKTVNTITLYGTTTNLEKFTSIARPEPFSMDVTTTPSCSYEGMIVHNDRVCAYHDQITGELLQTECSYGRLVNAQVKTFDTTITIDSVTSFAKIGNSIISTLCTFKYVKIIPNVTCRSLTFNGLNIQCSIIDVSMTTYTNGCQVTINDGIYSIGLYVKSNVKNDSIALTVTGGEIKETIIYNTVPGQGNGCRLDYRAKEIMVVNFNSAIVLDADGDYNNYNVQYGSNKLFFYKCNNVFEIRNNFQRVITTQDVPLCIHLKDINNIFKFYSISTMVAHADDYIMADSCLVNLKHWVIIGNVIPTISNISIRYLVENFEYIHLPNLFGKESHYDFNLVDTTSMVIGSPYQNSHIICDVFITDSTNAGNIGQFEYNLYLSEMDGTNVTITENIIPKLVSIHFEDVLITAELNVDDNIALHITNLPDSSPYDVLLVVRRIMRDAII